MSDVRYGVGSLEEEIRKVTALVKEGCEFKTQIGLKTIEEGKQQTVKLKRKGNIAPVDATLTMAVKNGTVTFNIKYADGGGENGVSLKKLAKMIGATA